jgi:hypothetical protein
MSCRMISLAGATATLAILTATAPAAAVTGSATSANAATPSPARARAGTVLLINGTVASIPAGPAASRPAMITAAGGGFAGSLVTLGIGGTAQEIPAAALPYIGRGLAPSLFDMPLLASEEIGGRLPVQVAYRGHRPRLPGVTITSATAGTARGYLTAGSARAFGAALVRQFVADHGRGSYGQDGLFADGATISLAGTPATRAAGAPGATAPAGAASQYPMHTLTVTGRNLAGRPDTGGQVFVYNVDDSRLLGPGANSGVFYHGTAKFSVPTGHYFALGDFVDVSGTGKPAAERLDVLPQFTVTKDTTVHLAERGADSEVAVVTPRPSVAVGTGFELRRLPRTGPHIWGYWVEAGGFPLWVSPVATSITAGTMQDYTEQWRTSPAGATQPYDYDLAYGATNRIPPQRFVARPGGLATIRTSYYSDISARGAINPLGLFRPQFADAVQTIFPQETIPTLPARRTLYVTGNPAITWWTGMGLYDPPVFGFTAESGAQGSGPMTFRAGQTAAEKLNVFPLHPGGWIWVRRHIRARHSPGDPGR